MTYMTQPAIAYMNAAVWTYRRLLTRAFRERDWHEFIIWVNVVNGVIPPELKFKWGYETDKITRYVRCPNHNCGKKILYSKDHIKKDYHYWCMTPSITGDKYSRYVECVCTRRVYIDEGDVEIRTPAVDTYNPEAIIKHPPSINPPAPEEVYFGWATMILPLIEDRFRRWRDFLNPMGN